MRKLQSNGLFNWHFVIVVRFIELMLCIFQRKACIDKEIQRQCLKMTIICRTMQQQYVYKPIIKRKYTIESYKRLEEVSVPIRVYVCAFECTFMFAMPIDWGIFKTVGWTHFLQVFCHACSIFYLFEILNALELICAFP